MEDLDVILIGEIHGNPNHARYEAKRIEEIKPRLVLSEHLNNLSIDRATELVDILTKYRTLKDLEEKLGIKINHSKIEAEAKKLIEEIAGAKDLNLVEGIKRASPCFKITEKSFYEIPFYKAPHIYGDILHTIYLENLGNIDHEKIRALLILRKAYHNLKAILYPEAISCAVYPLIKARELGILVAGFDHREIVGYDIPSRLQNLLEVAKDPIRERKMGERIVSYKRMVEGLLIAIVGRFHLREDSELLKVLNENKIKYRVERLDGEIDPYNARVYAYSLSI